MTVAAQQRTVTVALVGNPNTGKSTLFTALAGVRQRIGNYPGVTVEKKIGHLHFVGERFALVDLPGTYSLAPRSPDEMVVVDVLLGRRDDVPPCDVILCIVDASNLERNLYLVSQVLELGLPTVVALNMIDIAQGRGIRINIERLSRQLGIPVIATQANKHRGLDELKQAIAAACLRSQRTPSSSPFPERFQAEVAQLQTLFNPNGSETTAGNGASPSDRASSANANGKIPRYLVERLLLDTSGYLEQSDFLQRHLAGTNGGLREQLKLSRARLAEANCPVPAIEAIARYAWASRALEGVCTHPEEKSRTLTDKIDHVLTHKVWGTVVFAAVMFLLFSSIFVAAKPLMDWIGMGALWVQNLVGGALAQGALRSLVVDGMIGGVGSVVVFLPQILLLFMFIAILEDCGYMARAAYLMDKLMVRVGLSGKSFIPLLSSFACAIPGIMAARVIENRRDRLTTILVAPLMSCSARLPVYTLLIAAFIPGGALARGFTLFAMYLVGIVAAVIVALVLKRTILRGATPPFVMELPPYKLPSPALVLHRMVERGWAFIRRAGTLIVAVAIVVWALLYYPHNSSIAERNLALEKQSLAAQVAILPDGNSHREYLKDQLSRYEDPNEHDQLLKGAYERQSLLGRMGRFIEPAVKPLGWDWRIGCAAIASFPAHEVVLGTLGVIYNLGDVDLEESSGKIQLQTQLQNATWDGTTKRVFTVPVAVGLMVFFALCTNVRRLWSSSNAKRIVGAGRSLLSPI